MDKVTCIVTAGAGGMETQSCAELIFDMYCKWAARKGHSFATRVIEHGDRIGIVKAEFTVWGDGALEQLKCEQGVHKVTRISPFDPNARRHISFVSLGVFVDGEEGREINWSDVIRSYVFQPYQAVLDKRTGEQTSNIDDVFEGNLDMFIQAKLRGLQLTGLE